MNKPASAQVKGWCPGAWQPMPSGDGLLLRVRPPLGRLTPAQALRLARLAATYCTGELALSNRANVQLRGLDKTHHPAVMRALSGAGLLDANARQERLRNVLLDPLWQAGDGLHALAQQLQAAIAQSPGLDRLPAKFGWAVGASAHRLASLPADVKLMPAPADACPPAAWLVHPAGQSWALAASDAQSAIACAIRLAQWCARQTDLPGGRGMRLAQLLYAQSRLSPAGSPLPDEKWPAGVHVCPLPPPAPLSHPSVPAPAPGWLPHVGWLAAAPLGRISAPALQRLSRALHDLPGLIANTPAALRITPWRAVLIETPCAPHTSWLRASGLLDEQQWIGSAHDARLRISACVGAPACHQALAPTQPLALALAGQVPPGMHLHVSGCAKGCARQQAATITLCAQAEPLTSFAVIRHGTASGQASACWPEAILRNNAALLFNETARREPDQTSCAQTLPPAAGRPVDSHAAQNKKDSRH